MIAFNFATLGKRFRTELASISNVIEPSIIDGVGHLIHSSEFMARDCRLKWLVEGLLVEGQPAAVGGAKKALKTSTGVDLGVSLATGKSFLGHFPVRNRVRVGIISGESGEATLKETFRRVCAARRIADPAKVNIWWGFQLPQLSFRDDLDALEMTIRTNRLKVVILDPLYLCLLAGNPNLQAANLYHIGPLLADATAVCRAAGATPIFLHHTRMGAANSFEPPDLGDLAFAGIQEFVRQWILLGRREKYEPGSGQHKLWLSAGGSAGQSGCWALNINEGQLRPDFKGRRWLVEVRTLTEELSRAADRKERERRAKEQQKDKEDREKIRRVLRVNPDGESKNQIKIKAGLGNKTDKLIVSMLDDGEIVNCQIMKQAGRTKSRPVDGYRLADLGSAVIEAAGDD